VKAVLRDLISRNRSYRRFDQAHGISEDTLRSLVDLARLSASGGNMQPLRYVLSFKPERNRLVFPHLAWAGYLKDWAGPEEGERPSAYIIILGDTTVTRQFGCDHGIAAQSILLGATARGLGGCILGAIQRDGIRKALQIPERYEVLLVLALGKPAEPVVVESCQPDGDIKYWRDSDGVHHVPKRSLDDIILG
jgi:nitroreductase